MKKFLSAALLLFCALTASYAQNAITLPLAAQAVADIGNGPVKVRVTQGNASIFTSQGSGLGGTSGSSTALTLTTTPTTPPIVGGFISGIGITSGTTIAAYNGTTGITLSAAMTVAPGTSVAWGAACPSSAAGIPSQHIQASVQADYYLLYTQARVCAISPGGPANTLLILPVFYDQTTPGGGGGGSVSFANPTATAGPTAVNGTATTAMRSDAAPAVRLASASQSGLMPQWPGTTTTYFRGDGSFQTLNPAALSGLGTGTAAALGVNVGTAGSFVVNGGALGTPSSGTLGAGIAINYSAVTSSGTVPAANLPLVTNTSGAPSATAGAMKCDGTTITCTSGIASAVSGAGAPGGSNTQFQYNNSSAFGGAGNFAYIAGVPTVTNNTASAFAVQNTSSSSSVVTHGVQTAGSVPGQSVGGPFGDGNTGNLGTVSYTANTADGYSTLQLRTTNASIILSANGAGNTRPTIALGDSASACCYIPSLGTQPGMLFTYGQQVASAGPGPFSYNIANFGTNTGTNNRDVHLQVFSGQDVANSAQPGIFFWLVNSSPSLTPAVIGATGHTWAGDNIWQIGGFPYATAGYVQTENSSIRGTNDENCTNTGGAPVIEANTTCGGNVVFYNVRKGTGFNHVSGLFASSGTFAVGEWASSANAFTGGPGSVTLKVGTCPVIQTGGAGLLCVDGGGLKFVGQSGSITTVAPP